jgi:serine/threonine protein kinase
LITEWCEHGNLEEYLEKNPNLDWNIKVNIATGVANGLVFCHDRDILHHDMRSSNIMLDAHLCAKLSNFDLSRREQDDTVPGLSLADATRCSANYYNLQFVKFLLNIADDIIYFTDTWHLKKLKIKKIPTRRNVIFIGKVYKVS